MTKEQIMGIIYQITIIYIILICFAFFFANKMIFATPPSSYKDSKDIIKLKTADGVLISALYLPNPEAKYILLISQGNATDIGYSLPVFKMFYRQGFSVFVYDYHGYGTSQGKPTEKNTYLDIDAAYDYLTQELKISPDRIIAYGQSVGAAVAIDLASRKHVAFVIAQSPFKTAFQVLTQIPILPFDKYNNLKKLKNINCPILVIHGTRDSVVPFWHGKKVYKKAKQPKQNYWVEGAGHNDLFLVAGEQYFETLKEFIAKFLEKND